MTKRKQMVAEFESAAASRILQQARAMPASSSGGATLQQASLELFWASDAVVNEAHRAEPDKARTKRLLVALGALTLRSIVDHVEQR